MSLTGHMIKIIYDGEVKQPGSCLVTIFPQEKQVSFETGYD